MRWLTLLLTLLIPASGAHAHASAGVAGDGDSNTFLWFGLLFSTGVYVAGLVRSRVHRPSRRPVSPARLLAFIAAVVTLAAILSPPLEVLATTYFSAHMGQHLVLALVVAPLLAVSDAHIVMLYVFPLDIRRRIGTAAASLPGLKTIWRSHGEAWLAASAFAIALGVWHLPAAYDWALDHPWGHALEHITLIVTAAAFWRIVLTSSQRRLSPAVAISMATLLGAQGALMGAVIAFAPQPIYSAYAGNSIDDQALAGVMMCVPASLIYLASTIWALARMLRSPGRVGSNETPASGRAP